MIDPTKIAEAQALFEDWKAIDSAQLEIARQKPDEVEVEVYLPSGETVGIGFPADEAVRVLRARMTSIADRLARLGVQRPWPSEVEEPEAPLPPPETPQTGMPT